jgi:hypothetical protein
MRKGAEKGIVDKFFGYEFMCVCVYVRVYIYNISAPSSRVCNWVFGGGIRGQHTAKTSTGDE